MLQQKSLTFSYDDGVTQDIRLIELFNRYGMKATFNLNSDLLGQPGELIREGKHVWHNKIAPADIRHVYEGHEIASHTRTHPFLPDMDEEAIVREVEEDRLRLSELCGYEVVGFAYPGGGINYSSRVADIIRRRTGVRYARTTVSSHAFVEQDDLFEFHPTVYHHAEWDKLFALGEQFLALPSGTPACMYVWGHAYELDIHGTWDRFEDFLRMMAGHKDIVYGTNREVLL